MRYPTRRGVLRGVAVYGVVAATGCMGLGIGDPLAYSVRVQNETDERHEIQVVIGADDRVVFHQTVDLGPRQGDDSARVITESSLPAGWGTRQFTVSVAVDGKTEVWSENFRIDCQENEDIEDSLVIQLVSPGEVLVRESRCD